jgi:murein DD-endopeptidase MepM/ murein hydrolase activator NlpD
MFLLLTAFAVAAPPAVSITVKPLEPDANGSFIYATVAPNSGSDEATGMFWCTARITNDESSGTLKLTSVRVVLTGNGHNIVRDYARDLEIPAGEAKDSPLGEAEVISFSLPAPNSVLVRFYFEDNPTPKDVTRALIPYTPLVGSYIFPADEGDIGPEQYFSAGNQHLAPEGQLWGTDWGVYRITTDGSHTNLVGDNDPGTNESRLGWGVPIRAMAPGIVLNAVGDYVNNPRPGERAYQMMGQYDGEQIADVKVTTLSSTRAATLQRLASGQVQLSVWEITDVGRNIVRLGSDTVVPGEDVSAMAIDALSETRIVGLLRLNGTNNRRHVVWDVTSWDPFTLVRHPHLDGSGVTEVAAMAMDAASGRYATAVRTSAGDLEVAVREVDASGATQTRDSDTDEAATSVCISALSPTRIAASYRTATGLLRTRVWTYAADPPALTQRGAGTADAISRVVASVAVSSKWPDAKWVTAFRTDPGGQLKLIRWRDSFAGALVFPELETLTDVTIQDSSLAVAPAGGLDGTDNVATASIVGASVFKINGWGDPDMLPGEYEASAEETGPAVSRVSLDELSKGVHVAAVRTFGGMLKLMTWHWATGGGNHVYILHGNCRVLYAHFQAGSVDTGVLYPGATVAAGQMLGRMGNSGASGGPHTHIHADRIEEPLPSIETLLALEAADTIDAKLIGTRPIPFTGARAMPIANIEQGGDRNPPNYFATLNGAGMYGTALGIRPRLLTRHVDHSAPFATDRDGFKERLPGLPFPEGGPTLTVGGVLPHCLSGTRLYIRGGSYDETPTFNTPMTIRRYDYYDREPNGPSGNVIIGK